MMLRNSTGLWMTFYNFYCSEHASLAQRFMRCWDEPWMFRGRYPFYPGLLYAIPPMRGEAVDHLNGLSSFLASIRRGDPSFLPHWFVPLKVLREQYGSKGFKDLVGFGEAIKHLKEFVLEIIKFITTRRQAQEEIRKMELENEEREKRLEQLDLETQKKRLEVISVFTKVARERYDLLRHMGVSQQMIKKEITRSIEDRVDVIERLAESGQIGAIEDIDAKGGAG